MLTAITSRSSYPSGTPLLVSARHFTPHYAAQRAEGPWPEGMSVACSGEARTRGTRGRGGNETEVTEPEGNQRSEDRTARGSSYSLTASPIVTHSISTHSTPRSLTPRSGRASPEGNEGSGWREGMGYGGER